jgi:hypothetical protein
MNTKLLLTVDWITPAEDRDASHAVRSIGGRSGDLKWEHSQEQAISYIERGLFEYFVREHSQNLKLKVATTMEGRKYLKVDAQPGVPVSDLDLPVHN